MSPLLTAFVLSDCPISKRSHTMYADDGISENLEPGEEDLLDSKEHGVEINKSKSG
jgi:hypothetical protein